MNNLGTVASCLVVQVESSKNNNSVNMSGSKPRRLSLTLEEGNPEGMELVRQSLKTIQQDHKEDADASHVFVVFGASGDLAKKKIYPTLWMIFKESGLLPKNTRFVGYARSKLTVDDIKAKCKPYMKVIAKAKLLMPKIWRLSQRSKMSIWTRRSG